MSNRRILGFVLLAVSLLVWLVLRQFFGWSLAAAGAGNPILLGVASVGAVLAALAVVASVAAVWRSERTLGFLLEVVDEMGRVVWPTRQETQDSTLVVLLTVVVMSLVLWAFDVVWIELSNFVLYNT